MAANTERAECRALKIRMVLEKYPLLCLRKNADRKTRTKMVEEDTDSHRIFLALAFFLLLWRGRGGSSKRETVRSGRKRAENSFNSPRMNASSRKARRDTSPVVSKRRRLPRLTPERSASSACVIFSSSRRALALAASSRWTS